MTKVRLLVFLSTVIVVGLVSLFVSYYARGYRLNLQALLKGSVQFEPSGILVIKSDPDGASVILDGELKTATNATISVPPGTYDLEVKKDGYFSWSKRLVIEKEVVTSINVSLFKNVPSLSPVTFSGAQNPVVSQDGTKIAYVVPTTKDNTDKAGLWTLDVLNLPLGFSTDPRRILDGNLEGATFMFSPDERQILVTLSNGVFLIDSGSFTPQNQLVNVSARKESILDLWEDERAIKNESLLKNLPAEIQDVLTRRSSNFVFSPDGMMIAYTASSSANIPKNLIKQLPGSSTQKESRDISPGHTYVYDIKEDRNFLISDREVTLTNPIPNQPSPAVRWLTTSRHLLVAEEGKISILDYDGTNSQVVYSGSFVAPFAFPHVNASKLLILTNLGAISTSPNLYTLTVK